jgi:NitT/TauT family transport system ATP-binding protein
MVVTAFTTNASHEGADKKPRAKSERTLIRMKGAGVTFDGKSGRVVAVEGLDGEVRNREFISIVGPSGCGKSTVLRMIAGLMPLSAGSIDIDGETPGEARLSRRFGFVFQQSVMLPWRTALDNVMMPSEVMAEATPARREEALLLLERVGLKGYENLYPRQLSGGMRQRVSIARALSFKPPIMLMDEPFGALDALTRQKLHSLLLELWEANRKTVLFVTHDVAEAVFLSDRVFIMTPRPGRIDCEVRIDLPRPRTQATRSMPCYLSLVDEILGRLMH